MYIKRIIPLYSMLKHKSVLLLGPRRTGKSSLIEKEISADKSYDLLQSDVFLKLSLNPAYIRESLTSKVKVVVIDEIQKLPILMDEVHHMIEKYKIKFVLSGSSARKLRRTHTSLLAGRAHSMQLFPFVSAEIPDFKLSKIFIQGTLPPIYLAEEPWLELKSYVGDYLKEEIMAEALTRNITHFSRFLKNAALANTEILNFESLANDAQVSSKLVREYYYILEDTLLGHMVEPFTNSGKGKSSKRKTVSKAKFYFFDLGVVNALTDEKDIVEETPAFGKRFEHFIFLELFAYLKYNNRDETISFWRKHNGDEVDFIVGDSLAIEVKSNKSINNRHLNGMRSISEEHKFKRKIVISRDSEKRVLEGVEIYPYRLFLSELWNHEII